MTETAAAPSGRGYRWLYIGSLMLAGESIYMLPYMRKTFQTSMEAVFQISGTEVGLMNSMFGILALACYFPGGWLADRISARKLLSFSLLTTGLGGFYMAGFPGYAGLLAVHALWGMTTILTFWAALIKATRHWGGQQQQGLSFGLLDGGRGLVGAVLASTATAAFAWGGTAEAGLTNVILVYSLAPIAAAILVWRVIPDGMFEGAAEAGVNSESVSLRQRLDRTLRIPEVWLLAAVILAAYLLFIGTYDLPGFAERGFGESKVFGAVLGTFRDWMRPVAAVGAGVLADRFRASRTVSGGFLVLVFGYATLFAMPVSASPLWLLWLQVALLAAAVFALRGIYFALLQEIGVPMGLTGTAVGFVSVIGFAPDIFAHLLAGWFVDSGAGALGYQSYFGFLSLVAMAGLAAGLGIQYLRGNAPGREHPGRKRY